MGKLVHYWGYIGGHSPNTGLLEARSGGKKLDKCPLLLYTESAAKEKTGSTGGKMQEYLESPFDGSKAGAEDLTNMAYYAISVANRENNLTRLVELLRLVYWLNQ